MTDPVEQAFRETVMASLGRIEGRLEGFSRARKDLILPAWIMVALYGLQILLGMGHR